MSVMPTLPVPQQIHPQLRSFLHPYIFVLEEGKLDKNPMDYSLVLLQMRVTEHIPSPKGSTLATLIAENLSDIPPPSEKPESATSPKEVNMP